MSGFRTQARQATSLGDQHGIDAGVIHESHATIWTFNHANKVASKIHRRDQLSDSLPSQDGCELALRCGGG
jgi:hypothetical protein